MILDHAANRTSGQTPTLRVLGSSLGECVHVAGVVRFLDIAHGLGCQTFFTGPATDLDTLVGTVLSFRPDIVGVSYRLTADNARTLFLELHSRLSAAGVLDKVRIFCAGTPPVAAVARDLGFFDVVFSGGESPDDVRAALLGTRLDPVDAAPFPQRLTERIAAQTPRPLLRHHFGVPHTTIEPTVEGIARIADAQVLDVISLGPDQDAQDTLFRPALRRLASTGAGGVPFRNEQDLERLYAASRRGNYPLLRSYSGTRDHVRYAETLVRTINNAWCATSLFWFNAMDGRGGSSLTQSIVEHQALMAWHGERGIPVEGNEPHHWGLRGAPDVVVCAAAYLHAWNAKRTGVTDYVMTHMFQTPPTLSNAMDLAKCLACVELTEMHAGGDFRVWRQTRSGLLSYPTDRRRAVAHLAQSTMLQMAVKPHIIHIVGSSEADHAATANDVIESAVMTHEVVDTALRGNPDMTHDPLVRQRTTELVAETMVLIDAIRRLGATDDAATDEDLLTDPRTLARAVRSGLLDAPQLRRNPFGAGVIRTRTVDGAVRATDDRGNPVSERQRTAALLATARMPRSEDRHNSPEVVVSDGS
jgi:hypothetical protein